MRFDQLHEQHAKRVEGSDVAAAYLNAFERTWRNARSVD
jgi:hypothetical protein